MRLFGWQVHHWIGLIAVALVAAALPALIHGAAFYNIDDAQSQFLPSFHEIGRQLSSAQLPLISLRSWFGGNLVGEYQYAIFNPVSDLLYVAFYNSTLTYDQQATAFAIFHLVNLAAGTFVACRALRCRFDEALYVSLLVCTGVWLIYWAAMTWLPLLVALSWCAWAIGCLLWLTQERRWFLGAAVAIGMTGLSGSPHIDLVLMIFVGVMLIALLHRRERRDFMVLLAAVMIGGALALPAGLPLIDAFADSSRPIHFAQDGYLAPPQIIFAFGLPIFASSWIDWDGVWRPVILPQAYIDWAFPFLALSACLQGRSLWRDRLFTRLVSIALILLLLSLLPAVGPFRYPFRFIPAMILIASLAIGRYLVLRRDSGEIGSGWTWRVLVTGLFVPTAIAAVMSPKFPFLVPVIVTGAAIIALLAVIFILLPRQLQPNWVGLLCGLHMAIFILIISFWPSNPGLLRYALTAAIVPANGKLPPEINAQSFSATGNSLFLFEHKTPAQLTGDNWRLYGNVPYTLGGRAISGYSALGPAAVQNFFHFAHMGDGTTDYLDRLFQTDPATGRPYAELFRVDRLLAQTPYWIAAANQTVPADWSRQPMTPQGDGLLLAAPATQSFAGTLSFLPAGVTAQLQHFDDRSESWVVKASDQYDGRPLVFARPWYLGYHLYLNGVETPVGTVAGVVPTITLPAGFAGSLRLSFMPNSLIYGVIGSGFGLLAGLVLQYRLTRPRSAPAPAAIA